LNRLACMGVELPTIFASAFTIRVRGALSFNPTIFASALTIRVRGALSFNSFSSSRLLIGVAHPEGWVLSRPTFPPLSTPRSPGWWIIPQASCALDTGASGGAALQRSGRDLPPFSDLSISHRESDNGRFPAPLEPGMFHLLWSRPHRVASPYAAVAAHSA
jgi:hypothetical protein